MGAAYPLNARVEVLITKVIPSGLLGRVGDRRAIIRRREISWREPNELDAYVGQTRPAVVIGYNPAYDELELSLRLVERDPWREVPTKYRVGTIVGGRVQGLTRDAAFVEIEKGVEGFLHIGDLLPQSVERIEDLLWIGDYVKAVVIEVDPLQRRLRLSIRDLLMERETRYRKELWSRYQDATAHTTVAARVPEQIRLQLYRFWEPSTSLTPVATLRTLVIEDDEAFGPGLVNLLKRNGCTVVLVRDAMSALNEVHNTAGGFDLILIDWGLPDTKGHELVHLLQNEGIASRLVMVLDPAPLRHRNDIWHDLQEADIDILLKSDDESCQSGLLAILGELRGAAAHRRHMPDRSHSTLTIGENSSQGRPSPLLDHQDTVQSILDRLQKDTGATTASLVSLDQAGRLGMVAQVGEVFPLDQAAPDVIHSPLGDILQQGQEVFVRQVYASARFERLLAVAPFQSFIGIPLPAVDKVKQGLLLLKRQGVFASRDRELARVSAYVLARTFTGSLLLKSLQPWQGQNLAGQMMASAIHEIDNKLMATKLHLDALQEMVAGLWQQPQKASDPAFLQDMEDSIKAIAVAWANADAVRRQYLSLTGGADSIGTLDINENISDMVRLLQVEARSNSISLTTDLANDLPPVRATPGQIRQILWNLVLNAIQQMAQMKRQGRVTVTTSYRPGSPRPVHIRVSDEGPGIHTALWERIFEFGVTTRKGGAGLGLTICRQAAADLGGELRIEESFVLWGTTFVLELPQEVRS